MKQLLFLGVFISSFFVQSQDVKVMKFPKLQKKILTADAPLTIFNFWATWCGPCVREMPHFDRYANNPDVKVYLISLDFEGEIEKVKKFVMKKGIKSEVIHLNEKDYDSYMAKVSNEWTGAIPATLFVDEWGKTYFHENEFTKDELDKAIKKYLN
ncbi:MAG: TlpA family protein disulfide reductase [Cytophagales bacterium]|nr:TlpA family protein disulfide reductase [Cytophagales bacterium]